MIAWRNLSPTDGLRLAVLGDPIEHSLSPRMQSAALRGLEIEGEYIGLRVKASELEECVAHLASVGFTGINLTIPHKEAGATMAKGDDTVNAIGTANTLKFSENGVLATNTDVGGFLAPLRTMPERALVLGAGGAAIAVVYALRKNEVQVYVWNRSIARAEDLSIRFGSKAIDVPDPEGCELIVNATPMGLRAGEQPSLVWEKLQQGATVYDIVYRIGPTDFLEKASRHGAKVIDGREMLVEQGALSLQWWVSGSPLFTSRHLARIRRAMRKAVGL